MPELLLNRDAIAHNAALMRKNAGRWKVEVLPVLKAVCSHDFVADILAEHGFTKIGISELPETRPDISGARDSLICLAPLTDAPLVVRSFARSFAATPQLLAALDQASSEFGRAHEVLLMVDLGDAREGVAFENAADLLDTALSCRNLKTSGFGCMLGCLGNAFPDESGLKKLEMLAALFREKTGKQPVISVGGSIYCAWLEEHGSGPVTELRTGDTFLVGKDMYHSGDLPGGPFRRDAFLFSAEVLEINDRRISPTTGCAGFIPPEEARLPVRYGVRRRALLNAGYFHTQPLDLTPTLPGAEIVACSSSYMVMDVTDCPARLEVGSRVFLRCGYRGLASASHSPAVKMIPVTDEVMGAL